ncbi:hypothetical protein [Halomonas huangheensis]|uniref:Excinuclease ATPase subunit n=1 Tax=Halomonas huangheensis TaxID=1178482 RepID=W1N3B7_9GAMM|nr:hypothetical protein [Halomonas huangheensis]ALM51238.1 hypothetical protein AR456_02215 [Halomonas huangheensis]ERL49661.1 hypothetical protein BJB45_00655 [Halomonas huangheensis]
MNTARWLTSALLIIGSMAMMSSQAVARDTPYFMPIQEVLDSTDGKAGLDTSIRLVFSPTSTAQPVEEHGPVVTNRKTNALNKTDEEACRWVMLSALIALQDRAKEEGGNAVINIRSFYDQKEFESDTEYECHAGALMAGVSLRGDVVTLP